MIGLDTSVVVRYLVGTPVAQALRATRLIEHIQRAGHASRVRLQRVLDAPRHRGDGRLVEDAIDTMHCSGNLAGIADVSRHELKVISNGGQVATAAGGEVIQDAHAVAPTH